MSTDLLDLIKRRRSVREYADQPVSDAQVRAVLEAAVYAPTRHGEPPWHFVVLRDKVLQSQIAVSLRVHGYLEKAPVVVAVWAEPELSATWLMDCSAAIENMLLAAQATGLGAVWVGGPGSLQWEPTEKTLRKELEAPKEAKLVSLVALGVPAAVPEPYGKERWDHRRMHLGTWKSMWE